MVSKAKRVITSVKIPQTLYEDFKVTSVKTKMSLQDIVESDGISTIIDDKLIFEIVE